MKSTKTRTTAARLDHFKKADHGSQRRVEEGFAVSAGCIAENNKSLWAAAGEALTESLHDMEIQVYMAPIKEAWQRFKAIDWWQEIKEAFPFFNSESIVEAKKAMAPKGTLHLMQCKLCQDDVFIDKGGMAELSRHGVDKQELLSSCEVVCGKCMKKLKARQERLVADNKPPCRGMPEPINLAPYYIAVAVLAAVLIFHGLACEFGLVEYSLILK